MKIDVIFGYDFYEEEMGYWAKIEDGYDVEIFAKIINNVVIRIIKESNPIKLLITNVEYIDMPIDKIKNVKYINGPKKKKMIKIEDDDIKIIIDENSEFEISIPWLFCREIKKIDKIGDPRFDKYKISISNEVIQNKSFNILKEYMNKKPYDVIYGNDVIKLMNDGLIKVAFISWKFLKRQDDEIFEKLTNVNNKFNKTNLVVMWKENINYNELIEYGGIIGVLY